MSAVFKKIFLASILMLVVLTTGAWQSNHVVLAEGQNIPETPLYQGLTWTNPGSSSRDITTNVNGDSISLSGESHEAVEQFAAGLPQGVLNYYSNEQLAKSGWASYDAHEGSDGVHYIFYHESGAYLSVEFLKCPDVPSSACVTVWKSEQIDPTPAAPSNASERDQPTAEGSFGKSSPTNGATNLNPTSIVLSWGTYSPTPDKYSYCVKEGQECDENDPNWTGTYTNTSVTLTNLAYDKTYHWQVKAITCADCVPKIFVYANGGTWWTFRTRSSAQAGVVILGNAGVGGAVLSYTDGTPKTVTADGAGHYSITVPNNWSGTVTPSKAGYAFSPTSASFVNLTAPQTIQNFTATTPHLISGNVVIAGVILSYTDGTAKTATSLQDGSYSLQVSGNWSGTVTPSHPCFTFSPTSRTYSNVIANLTGQNYTPTIISGCANIKVDIGGVNQGTYGLPPQGSQRVAYALDSGPVKVFSTNGVPIIAALRDAWLVNGQVTSFSQLMGLPKEQLSDTYLFPAYNNITLSEQIRFANVDTVATTVTVKIGGAVQGTYNLNPSESLRVTYALDSGPVEVKSSGGTKIIAAIRDSWLVNGQVTSFTQIMGLPKESLSDTYLFPAYNNVTLSGQLRIGNVDTVATTVTVKIAGAVVGTYPLNPSTSVRVTYALDAGPVEVSSSGGVKIIAALRDAWLVNGQVKSFAQLMGLPKEALSDTYLFPAYNNVTLSGQLRIGNVDTVATTVTVKIGGVVQGTYPLNPSASVRVTYPLDTGPVEIKSSGGTKIIAALRDAWLVNGAVTSFVQMMGLPNTQLSDTYWFPAYNNITLSGQLRFGVP